MYRVAPALVSSPSYVVRRSSSVVTVTVNVRVWMTSVAFGRNVPPPRLKIWRPSSGSIEIRARLASVSVSLPSGTSWPSVVTSTIDPGFAPVTCTALSNSAACQAAFVLRTTSTVIHALPISPGQRAIHRAVVPLTAIGSVATP